MAHVCSPIYKLLKKGEQKEWNEECQKAFEWVKEYLLHPPVLQPPRLGEPLLLYLSITDEALGAMLAQKCADTGKENAIYYLTAADLFIEIPRKSRGEAKAVQ